MPPYFSSKLCHRKEPERGCLARVTKTTVPKGRAPIFDLPAEVRAHIFEYLVSEVDLRFELTESLDCKECCVSWADFRRNLAFLKTCKLFEAEGLKLVRVKTASLDMDFVTELKGSGLRGNKPLTRYKRSQPQKINLRLDCVRPYLIQASLDSKVTMQRVLASDLLTTFPKLRVIRIVQSSPPQPMDHDYRNKLNTREHQQRLVSESLAQTEYCKPPETPRQSGVSVTLLDLLQHEKLSRYPTILIHQTTKAFRPYSNDWLSGDDTPAYPLVGVIAAVRLTYQWPTRQVTGLEIDMFNQPLPLAVKTQWKERLDCSVDNGS